MFDFFKRKTTQPNPTPIDKENGFFELKGTKNVTFIVFGGVKQGLGLPDLPPFEFARSLQKLGYSILFIRDIDQAWYHKGAMGLGQNTQELCQALHHRFEDTSRLIMMGNSMGGFASLLFGYYLDAPIRLAFSPQSFMDKRNRAVHGETRWEKQIAPILAEMPEAPTLDLCNILTIDTLKNKQGSSYLFYSASTHLDKIHAERLEGLPKTNLYPFNDSSHQLAKKLKEEGLLEGIIVNAAESILNDDLTILDRHLFKLKQH